MIFYIFEYDSQAADTKFSLAKRQYISSIGRVWEETIDNYDFAFFRVLNPMVIALLCSFNQNFILVGKGIN